MNKPPRRPPRTERRSRPRPEQRAASRARNAPEVGAPARVQKLLPTHGIGSRRQVEEWIREGRLTINETPATLGQSVTAADRFALDGRRLKLTRTSPARVFAYRKKLGEVVTQRDPQRRATVFQRLPKVSGGRWIAIGRLDINTSGLLLFTTDGELAKRLMHPSFEIEREYAVRVLGGLSEEALKQLREGVPLDDGMARVSHIETEQKTDSNAANLWYRLVLTEGRNREVRRLIEAVGGQVSRLMRVRYGPIPVPTGVPSGRGREVEGEALAALYQAVDLSPPQRPAAARPRRR